MTLLVFQAPFGFVAILGVIALAGIVMRNSVILVDQVQQDIASGYDGFTAIVESAVRRFRPIALTAAAAVLALIPLTRESFWAPMALAHDGWRHRGHRPDADLPACPLRARISRESAGGWESAFRR